MADIMRPHVNNNGTSRTELIRMRLDAMTALREAILSHRPLYPHGRDYQGGGNQDGDLKIWQARDSALKRMFDDIEKEIYVLQGDLA